MAWLDRVSPAYTLLPPSSRSPFWLKGDRTPAVFVAHFELILLKVPVGIFHGDRGEVPCDRLVLWPSCPCNAHLGSTLHRVTGLTFDLFEHFGSWRLPLREQQLLESGG